MLCLICLILLGVGGSAALVFVMLIFVLIHWERTKTNFIRWAIAFVVCTIGFGMVAVSTNAYRKTGEESSGVTLEKSLSSRCWTGFSLWG